MRKLLILGVIFLAGHAYSQEFTGRYSASFIGAESIEFLDGSHFTFNGSYCTFGQTGKGIYAIKGNKLYLYFEKKQKTETVKKPALIEKDTSLSGS